MRRLIALVPVAVLVSLAACGGGGNSTIDGGSGSGTQPSGSNVAQITVDAGPTQNSVNTPFISVTVCPAGSTTGCQTIDHIELDTGSYGLRLISSVVSSSLTLTSEQDTNGDAVYECAVFGDGYSWGSVKLANLQIAGETASGVPIQIIGDPASSVAPASCSSMGSVNENTVASFGANGILGVGPFVEDSQFYYTCPSGVCGEVTDVQNVSNPVAFFAADNNGVVVELPAVPATGSGAITGSLIFGIGTRSNNGLGSATVYSVDPSDGNLTITYNNVAYNSAFFDSGSNANIFVDSSIPTCSDFFCPTSTLSLMATVTGVNMASNTVQFSVANADDLFSGNPTGVAFDNLGAPDTFGSDFFDFGLPFFFGRNVYTAIADASTPGGIGPYVAF